MFKASGFKLPSLKGVTPTSDRGPGLPDGDFLLVVEKVTPKVTRAGDSAIIAKFHVESIAYQKPYTKKDGSIAPEIVVGQSVDHYFQLGGPYGYGEKEWAGFLIALGFTEESEREEAQEHVLGEENVAEGERIRLIKAMPKTHFLAPGADEAEQEVA